MAQNAPHTTAKIYRFPARPAAPAGRAASGMGLGARLGARAAPPCARVEFGSGWYHDAAIEAEKSPKP